MNNKYQTWIKAIQGPSPKKWS